MARRQGKQKRLHKVLPDLAQVYRYFWPEVRPHRRLVMFSFSTLLAGVVLRLLEPWPLKFLLDYIFAAQVTQSGRSAPWYYSLPPLQFVILVSIFAVLVTGFRATADYASRVGFFNVGNRVVIAVRSRLFRHLQYLPMAFHVRARRGDLIVRLTRDVSLLRDVTSSAILPLVGSSLVLLGMLIVMLWISLPLALLAIAVVPIYWLCTVRVSRKVKNAARKQRERESAIASILSESLAAISTIKMLSLEDRFASKFDASNRKGQSEEAKANRHAAKLTRSVDILLAIATALVLAFGAFQVTDRRMTPGELVVFLTYLKRSFKPAQEFAKYTTRIAKATVAGKRVMHVLGKQAEPIEPRDRAILDESEIHLKLRDLTFAYPDGTTVLDSINIEVAHGQCVAIVGPSGSGKSTLLQMLMRIHEPTSGAILANGRDLQSCSLSDVRSWFTVVPQEPYLFAGTVQENIECGSPADCLEGQVTRAARLAMLDDFLDTSVEILDTEVTEQGSTFSRGQCQRIAIARAAVRPSPIILLDEPTAGLDRQNERLICRSLEELRKDRTMILVTHSPLLASIADQVIVLDRGVIRQSGTYESIVHENGPYRALLTIDDSPNGTPGPLSKADCGSLAAG